MKADETKNRKKKNNAGSTIKHPATSADVNHDACIHACIHIYNKTARREGKEREGKK